VEGHQLLLKGATRDFSKYKYPLIRAIRDLSKHSFRSFTSKKDHKGHLYLPTFICIIQDRMYLLQIALVISNILGDSDSLKIFKANFL